MRMRPFKVSDLETINSDGGTSVTGHDLLSVFSDLLTPETLQPAKTPLHYMEIGVAQGRNIYGTLHTFGSRWHSTAFSFERINPPLEAKIRALSGQSLRVEVLEAWTKSNRTAYKNSLHKHGAKYAAGTFVEEDIDTNPGFFPYTITQYTNVKDVHGNVKAFTYAHADAYDSNAWGALTKLRQLDVGPWQLLLSDAEHTDETVQYECDNYVKYTIIDFSAPFAVLWDDEMMNSYCGKILQSHSTTTRLSFASVKVMGRTGMHVWQFATSLSLQKVHLLGKLMHAGRVPHYLVYSDGRISRCCARHSDDLAQSPPKPPPMPV